MKTAQPAVEASAGTSPEPIGAPPAYLIVHSRTALSLSRRMMEVPPLVLTTSWPAEEILRRSEIPVIQIEDLLTEELANEIDRFVLCVIQNWYRRNSEDFSVVDGISLGQALEYRFFNCGSRPTESFTATHGVPAFVRAAALFAQALEKVRSRVLIHDLKESAQLDALRIVAAKFGLALKPWTDDSALHLFRNLFSQMRDRFQWFRSQVRRFFRVATNVCCGDFEALAGLRIYRVARSILSRRPHGARSVAMVMYSCLRLVKAELESRGHPVTKPWDQADPILAFANSRRLRNQWVAVNERWSNARSDPAWRAGFVFQGMDLWEHFDGLFSRAVEEWFPQTLRQAFALRRFFERHQVGALVVPFDSPDFARLCVLTARQAKIPTLVVQHGLYAYHEIDNEEFTVGEHACVIGEADAKMVARRQPKVDVHCVGCLQLDFQKNLHAKVHAKVRPRGDFLEILVLTNGMAPTLAASKAIDSARYLDGVVRALSRATRPIKVTLKLHPSETRQQFEAVFRLLDPTVDFELAEGWTLPALLPQCDLVISPASTAIAEALALGKPVLRVDLCGERSPPALDEGSGLPISRTSADLAAHLKEALEGYSEFVARYPFGRILDGLGPQDGRAAVRVADIVESLLDKTGGGC